MNKATILERLNQVVESVKNTHDALAFLALGSIGKETARLDEFSDLDFFVICKPDKKERFIKNVDWLVRVYPEAFYFQNTKDGLKFVFEDGILCEFAVFTEEEFSHALYSEGKFLWKDLSFVEHESSPKTHADFLAVDESFLVGEVLTNLYVGLGRYIRGEKLSGFSFVQNYALHSVLILIAQKYPSEKPYLDVFNPERRFEQRHGLFAKDIPWMCQGYDRTPESAQAILDFVCHEFTANTQMVRLIRGLIERAIGSNSPFPKEPRNV